MTWGEFKKAVEENGVEESDELDWIDTDSCAIEIKRIQRTQDDDNNWYVSIYSI